MAEEISAKSKRDLMWEQKKKLREEKLRSNKTSQDITKPIYNEPIYSNANVNSNENIKSSENIPLYMPENNKDLFTAQKNNIYNNMFTNDMSKLPASVPSKDSFHNNNNDPPNNKTYNNVMKSNNELYSNNMNNNYPIGNLQQNEVNLSFNDNNNNKSKTVEKYKNIHQSVTPNEDPNAINKVIKKEYGDFLKNQMKEKENRKVNGGAHNKVEALQNMMENQAYNPFGRPGGGGPNKKIAHSNPDNMNYAQNNENYSQKKNPIINNNINNNNNIMMRVENDNNNYFQANDYNSLMQNNLQNLQKEKMKLMNYKNFMNQNNQMNSNNNNNYNYNNDRNIYNQQFSSPIQNMPQNLDNNNENFRQAQYIYEPPNYNNNMPAQYDPPNNYDDINNNNMNFNNKHSKNAQNYENNSNDQQKNFISLNNDNNSNNNPIVPSLKVRTGRNRLMYENMGENELIKKEAKAQEMQKALSEQIELKKRQKEMEKERQRQEELVEEAKLLKEREQLEYEIKMEEEKKKAKFEKVRQDNLDLKEDKKKVVGNNNNNQDVSKDISSENLGKKPLILRTDVSKEFLEQEGKQSRRNIRGPKNNINITENILEPNNNEHVPFNMNNNQTNNDTPFNMNNNNNNNYNGYEIDNIQKRRDMEIQNIKNDARNQQKNMQQKLLEIQNEAANAIKQKNQAEEELINLRQQLKEKMFEEQKYKQNLLIALTKNDPNQQKRRSSGLKLSNEANFMLNDNNNMPDLSNYKRKMNDPTNITPKIYSTDPNNNNNLSRPLKIFERGGITANRDVFQEANIGDRTLISDTKMIPLDILDHYAKNPDSNNPLTLSKIGNFAIRPNSSNMLENSNRYEKFMDTDISNNQNIIIKKRPYSQKNQRYDKFSPEQSVNTEITKEIDLLLNNQQNQLNMKNINTFNSAAKGVLEIHQYDGGGIKLDSEFPTLKDQSLYSIKSHGVEKSSKNTHIEEIEKMLRSKDKNEKYSKNEKFDENYKDQTQFSTLNIEEVNKKNDDRLKEIDMMAKFIDGGNDNYAVKGQRNNLRIIEEEDEMTKLDKLIKNF